MIVNLSCHQKSVVSSTQHMPRAGGGVHVPLASHNPPDWLVCLSLLPWALLSPSRAHCVMLGSCSPICYLCMKCPGTLTGVSLLQPVRWLGTRCLIWERTSSFVGSFWFHPRLPYRSDESIHSVFALPRSSLTAIVQSLCKCCAVFHCPLSCFLVCLQNKAADVLLHVNFALCNFHTLDCLRLSSVNERWHSHIFRRPVRFLLKIVNAFNKTQPCTICSTFFFWTKVSIPVVLAEQHRKL